MAANTLLTSIVTGGSNNHTTTAEEANAIATDFISNGVVGAITLNSGSGGTGSYCVNADASPDMGVTIKAGQAYVTATPSSQNSQVLRVRAAADYTAYTINSNASGSTKYDWVYLSISATNANTPSSDGSNVASFVTSRSTSNSTDTGSPPTYGLLLAIITVANGASSITNSNITDKRYNTSNGAQAGSLIVQQNGTGTNAIVQAAGIDTNVTLNLATKGTGVVDINGVQIGQQAFKNSYKFSVYRNASWNTGTGSQFNVVSFDTKTFDTGTNVDVVTNKGRFTAPVAGFYYFTATVGTSTTNIWLIAALYKNGSIIKKGQGNFNAAGAINAYNEVNGLLQLAANDYIEVYLYSNTSTQSGLTGATETYFDGFLLSAA